jgi:hypothetical protein
LAKLNKKTLVTAVFLVAIVATSLLAAVNLFGDPEAPEFFVGVEFAYSDDIDYLKALVDEVKDYTNLFVIGSIEVTFNQTALNKACDYIVDANLSLIVLLTDSQVYDYNTFTWMTEAKQKYGEKFLGVYRYDEPGGNQLDKGASMLVKTGKNYTEVATNYTNNLRIIIDYYLNYSEKIFTADYGLYWFNYRASYSAVFAEFGWNHSRPLNIALCRGAAAAHNKDWGAMVTWTYTQDPYLGSGKELYDDLELAYKAGARYAIVFSYPQIAPHGTLTEEHFDALEKFWKYWQSNPRDYGTEKAGAVYVLPKDYGFGFRNADDTIWGLFEADDVSIKIWNDVNILEAKYVSRFDIVYDDPEVINDLTKQYTVVYFWTQTVT